MTRDGTEIDVEIAGYAFPTSATAWSGRVEIRVAGKLERGWTCSDIYTTEQAAFDSAQHAARSILKQMQLEGEFVLEQEVVVVAKGIKP